MENFLAGNYIPEYYYLMPMLRRFIQLLLLFILGLALAVPGNVVAVSHSQALSLVPSAATYNGQEEIVVDVIYPGEQPVTSVKTYLAYDSSMLWVTGINTSESGFSHWWEKGFTRGKPSGEIRLQASAAAPQGTALIARIHFRALKAGTAKLTLEPESLALTAADTNVLDSTVTQSTPITIAGNSFYTPFVFGKDLQLGIQNAEVRELQRFLNANGFLIASTGPGSPGQETDYFGSLTEKAVIEFQEAHAPEILAPLGLMRGTGFVGPGTRAVINTFTEGTSSAFISLLDQSAAMPSTTATALVSSNLWMGMQSNEVRTLQELLARDPELYPEGLVTGYFGPLTEQAVQRFQMKHGVVSHAGDPGYGMVGPKTRAKFQEVFGS